MSARASLALGKGGGPATGAGAGAIAPCKTRKVYLLLHTNEQELDWSCNASALQAWLYCLTWPL